MWMGLSRVVPLKARTDEEEVVDRVKYGEVIETRVLC